MSALRMRMPSLSSLEYPAIAKLGQLQCTLVRHESAPPEPLNSQGVPSRLVPNVSCRQEQKKPTWRNTQRRSTTSAYSSTNPPAEPGCSSSSHPTTPPMIIQPEMENSTVLHRLHQSNREHDASLSLDRTCVPALRGHFRSACRDRNLKRYLLNQKRISSLVRGEPAIRQG